MKWNGKLGNDLVAEGQAKPKPPSAYKIVGTSPPRFDVPAKVFGQLDYVTDVKVPGMLHGRMIRPPVAGAVPLAVDESSVRDIPGVRVVHDKGFLGIVAEREWDAVQAAELLQVTWSEAAPPFPENAALYHHIRQAPVVKREVPVMTGEIDPAFVGAARVVEAEYEWPFQSHASMGPACAVVDARADSATLWTGSQKPHFARDGVARALGLPQDKVHGIWVPGPGSYGRNDAGDAGIDAALLSKAVGRPVRVQGMRWEGHGWDPKGPASIHRARAALDKDGAVIGYAFESKGFSRIDIDTNESDPAYSLAGQLLGLPLKPLQGFGVPAESYGFANKQLAWETIPPLLDRASPLRTAHLRDPVGPQIQFAIESFIDEIATAVGADAVAFRLRFLKAPHEISRRLEAPETDQQSFDFSVGFMPTISTFYGIVIRMYHRDHAPAHFHVFYQGNEAKIDIENLELMAGNLPRRVLGLVLDWAELHQNELRGNWTLAQQRKPINTISPLE